MQKGYDPYLNSGTTAATVPYNPLKLVSPGQNVQNLYYYSHYSVLSYVLNGRTSNCTEATLKSRDTQKGITRQSIFFF